MADPQTQPVLVRDDAVVATAVGVLDPSLTPVEFERGVGFLLARGFQADSFRARYFLEKVILWRTGDLFSESEHHRLVLLGDEGGLPDTEVKTARELEILSAHWRPAVFFLSDTEHAHLLVRLEDHDPERVLREAFYHAHRVEALRPQVLKLKARWEEELRGFRLLEQRVQPRKETVRISLPSKSLAKQTVRLELPPRSAAKESVQATLDKLAPEERAEIERWLKE